MDSDLRFPKRFDRYRMLASIVWSISILSIWNQRFLSQNFQPVVHKLTTMFVNELHENKTMLMTTNTTIFVNELHENKTMLKTTNTTSHKKKKMLKTMNTTIFVNELHENKTMWRSTNTTNFMNELHENKTTWRSTNTTVIVNELDENKTMLITRNSSSVRRRKVKTPRAVMVIAAFPNDITRLSTLWSELECFSSQFDSIVVAAPYWSRNILDPVLKKATENIPILKNKEIIARYFVNDRYDVGLWCDAFRVKNQTTFGYKTQRSKKHNIKASLLNQFDHFVLINDSVWALEHSSDVLDALRGNQTLQMVSLSYSNLGEEHLIPHGFWLESVKRAFTVKGLRTFLNHKCVPASHPFYCPERTAAWRRKRCIVENFEIFASDLYPPGSLLGLYPSDVPPQFLEGKNPNAGGIRTWVGNVDYWEHLRETMAFPVAKASSRSIFVEEKKRRPNDFLTCSRYIDALVSLNLTFPSHNESL